MKATRGWVCILSLLMAFALFGCAPSGTDGLPPQTAEERTLCLAVGDTYDFSQMGLLLAQAEGECIQARGNIIEAVGEGTASVVATGADGAVGYAVRVFPTARELGGRFLLDRGMFFGKKAIVFGDSITDGYMGDETNYDETYFALLCDALGISGEPGDLVNCNFACGGTTITYGRRLQFGISGAERVTVSQPFYDTGRLRDPASNIPDADLCVIFYGTNDFDENIPARAEGDASLTDVPTRMEDARTIKGAAYYMIEQLHMRNPQLKILLLPPLYRRKAGSLDYAHGGKDVVNTVTGEYLSEYGAALREAAQECGAKFIDWYPVFDFENFGVSSQYTSDGLHPNREGHRLMFEFLLAHAEQRNDRACK